MTLFSGCFSPIGLMPSNTGDKTAPDGQDNGSFAVDIYVNQDVNQDTRSVAGATSIAIRDGLYNFIQLIVVNEETGTIAAFDESRKEKSTDEGFTLQIDRLSYGFHYKFLLLFGYWERDLDADVPDGDGVILRYNEAAKPVLLSAAYKRQQVVSSGKITVTMWPLVINTIFEAEDSSRVEPVIGQAAELLATKAWWVKWTIGKNAAGNDNGLSPLLEAGSETTLPAGNRKYFVNEVAAEEELSGELTEANSTLTASLENYLGVPQIGIPQAVNFYLEYVPFNLISADWGVYDSISKFALSSSSPPVWIIRNGLNDKAQTDHTDFAKVGKPGVSDYQSYNGNGGVLFTVKDPHESGYYVKDDGNDDNSGSYYAPFKTLEKAVTMAHNGNKPVIVIGTLTQDNSGNTTTHNQYSTFLIQNKNVTVKGHPDSSPTLLAAPGKRVLATSGQVILENITLTGGNGQEAGAGIWIDSGSLTLGPYAWVKENGDTTTTRGGGIVVQPGATFNLEGGVITLNKTGKDALNGGGGGLFVKGTAYLKSGYITYNKSYNDGGGVIVGGGTVYMSGGTVEHNYAGDDGGGIGVDYNGTFIMTGGTIIFNRCEHYGGGLRLEDGSVEVKSGAIVAGTDRSDSNHAGSYGHAYARYGGSNSSDRNDTVESGFKDSR